MVRSTTRYCQRSFHSSRKTYFINTIPFTLFSQLGAVRFDRDLRAITTYLSSQTAFGDVREKFVRLQQIATLLNLDQVRLCFGSLFLFVVFTSSDGEQEEDVDEFYNGSGITWKLSEQDARTVAGLRL